MAANRAPRIVLAYGLLGLVPFFAPVVIGLWRPELAAPAAMVQAIYGALILSFLGGARWGFAVQAAQPDPLTISLSMLPTLIALATLALTAHAPRVELMILAAALVAQWAWDLRAVAAPAWFARLRTLLTLGAAAGLTAGAWAVG
jgi:hypothetical protein